MKGLVATLPKYAWDRWGTLRDNPRLNRQTKTKCWPWSGWSWTSPRPHGQYGWGDFTEVHLGFLFLTVRCVRCGNHLIAPETRGIRRYEQPVKRRTGTTSKWERWFPKRTYRIVTNIQTMCTFKKKKSPHHCVENNNDLESICAETCEVPRVRLSSGLSSE